MARIRTIKPEFWTDERLTECSLSARLLFIGMLNFSDDNGNQAHSAKRLKMQIFPADAIDVAPLLAELVAQRIVIEYSVGEEKYLHIKGFRKHQVINRPSSTTIPQPECSVQKHETHGVLTESSVTEGKGRERKEHTSKPKDISGKPEVSEGFANFWKTWPSSDRKTARMECFKRWKAKGLEGSTAEIIAHVEGVRDTKKWTSGYAPAPLTYLNQQHWLDGETEGGANPWDA